MQKGFTSKTHDGVPAGRPAAEIFHPGSRGNGVWIGNLNKGKERTFNIWSWRGICDIEYWSSKVEDSESTSSLNTLRRSTFEDSRYAGCENKGYVTNSEGEEGACLCIYLYRRHNQASDKYRPHLITFHNHWGATRLSSKLKRRDSAKSSTFKDWCSNIEDCRPSRPWLSNEESSIFEHSRIRDSNVQKLQIGICRNCRFVWPGYITVQDLRQPCSQLCIFFHESL